MKPTQAHPGSGFSFLSWNLAMLAGSAEGPLGWGMEATEAEIVRQVSAAAPDLVLFQELPRLVPFLPAYDMVRANPETHQGNLALLVRRDVAPANGSGGPVIVTVDGCGLLACWDNGLTVANVHLAPGPAAVAERLAQLARIVEASPTSDIVIIGDTNMRVAEEAPLADAGLRGLRPPVPTWDSKRNRFHSNGPRFQAYFTRWFATERVEVSRVSVWASPISDGGQRFHLSDHFAMLGYVALEGSIAHDSADESRNA